MIVWIRGWLMRLFPKYKLRRICRVLGITPEPWQRDFALNGSTDGISPAIRYGRQTGKTTAVMLRLLMMPQPVNDLDVIFALREDPDFDFSQQRSAVYKQIYLDYARRCRDAGIKVPSVRFLYLCRKYREAAQLHELRMR